MNPSTIDLEERRYIRSLLRDEGNGQPTAVVLVGSWARGTQTEPTSDLDLLVVGSPHSRSPVGRIQVIRRSVDQFRRLALGGDDFAQWALRYGKPVKGRQAWAVLRRELLDRAPWPNVKPKLDLAARRCRAAQDLLQMGDLDAADEETRFALSHLARALLLGAGVFPLSRPELAAQLQEIGETDLARLLNTSTRDEPVAGRELEERLSLLAARLSALTDGRLAPLKAKAATARSQ
ncbi:MAG: nucleotidyltransferase domain-containing protein [Dermatophilaceae bacterium]